MRSLTVAVVCLAATLAFVRPASAQDNNSLYQVEKKSEFGAVGLELVLPVLGHAYAGDARRGLVPGLVSVAGLVVMLTGAGDLDTGMMTIGYLAYLGGRGSCPNRS